MTKWPIKLAKRSHLPQTEIECHPSGKNMVVRSEIVRGSEEVLK